MSIVIDASVAFAWAVPSQRTNAADHIAMMPGLTAPALFPFEFRGGLLSAERNKRIARAEVDRQIARISPLIDVTAAPDLAACDAITRLARRYGLSFYDAAYLQLALVEGFELASRDAALLAAASRIGIQILDAR